MRNIAHMALVNYDDIEIRANNAGSDIKAVLREAGVHRATWDRWKAGTTTPQLANLEKIIAILERIEAAKAAGQAA